MPAIQAPPQRPAQAVLTRRNFLFGAASAAAGLAVYSNDIARHEVSVTHPVFAIPRLPPAFEGFRYAQISDLHLEEYTEDYFLRRIVRHVNQMKPDMVLVTGDFVSRGPFSLAISYAAVGRCAELLRELQCPVRYGVLGNHDWMVGSRIVRDHMESNGLPLLVNQFVRIERGGQYLYLGGLDDISFGKPDLNLAVPARPDAPVILLAHEPDYADTIATHPRGPNVDLILSGHTHGGQIRLPGIRPLALPPHGQLYPEGHYLVGSSQLYVNRGIGTVGIPFRLNCPPEITLATLRRA